MATTGMAGGRGEKSNQKSSGKLFRGSEFFGLTENQYRRLGEFDLVIASGCSASGCAAPEHEVSLIDSGLLRNIKPDSETITRWYYHRTIRHIYEKGVIPCPSKP